MEQSVEPNFDFQINQFFQGFEGEVIEDFKSICSD
jgi:hypothetical protein